jgi:hypothetical protein
MNKVAPKTITPTSAFHHSDISRNKLLRYVTATVRTALSLTQLEFLPISKLGMVIQTEWIIRMGGLGRVFWYVR